jgi:hypothetical protein
MARKLSDERGRKWEIDLVQPDTQNDEADEEMMIRFVPESDEEIECEIRIIGPIMEDLSRIGKGDIKLALEAAQNGIGFLFLDRDDRVWWIQGPEDDVIAEGTALTFVRGTEELHHGGPLPGAPEDLSEDELQELLDEMLGRVIG